MQVLDETDAGWDLLRVWQDRDQDGETDTGELSTLSDLNITRINLAYDDGSSFTNRSNDIVVGLATLHGVASFVRNGNTIIGGVGDFSLGHDLMGMLRVEIKDAAGAVVGHEYQFETGGRLRVTDLTEAGGKDVDLANLALDVAVGDEQANLLTAQNHARSVQITGGLGNDTIRGGHADDLLGGGVGIDQLNGFDGNDVLAIDAADLGAGGSVFGGQGIDTAMVEGSEGVNLVLVDTIPDGIVNRELEAAVGGTGADTIRAADTVAGAVNNDDVRISGRDGNDILSGDNGDDALTGDNGADQLGGGWGDDFLDGSRGDDTLWSGDGDDQLFGGDGKDSLVGGNQDDRLYGGGWDDTLQGGEGDDVLEGGWGLDSLHAGYGDDTVDGGDGNDTIGFWRGDAELWGRAGNDRFVLAPTDTQGHRGWSVVYGGIGRDTFVLHGSLSSWDVRVVDGDQWQLHRGSGSDRIVVDLIDIEIIEIGGVDYWRQDFADAVDALPGRDRPVIESANEDRDNSDDYVRANFTNGTGDDNTTANDSFTNVYGGTFLGWMGDDVLRGSFTIGTTQNGQPQQTVNGAYDAMDGGSGSDVLHGNATDETLIGNTGQDRIFGGAEDDTIIGGAGSDQVAGGTGNDSIRGDSGSDVLNGEAGNDSALGDSGNDVIVGGAGADVLEGGSGSDQLAGGDDGDTLDGETGFDRLYGDAGADSLIGGAGSDYLYGGAGNDTLRGGVAPGSTVVTNGGVNYLAGGDGDDHLTGASLDDQLAGQAGTDTLLGGSGRDILLGGAGADSLDGGAGLRDMVSYEDATTAVNVNLIAGAASGGDAAGDVLVGFEQAAGSAGNDTLTGREGDPDGSGDNLLVGNAGDDAINGRSGDDDLFGGDGIDTILGGHGADRLYGGDGNDSVVGGDLDDTVFGDEGNDIVEGEAGIDLLNGAAGNDTLRGGDDQDSLYGGGGVDLLNGQAGADLLHGHSGDDELRGEQGADTLNGHEGADLLFAGVDIHQDVFVFASTADSTAAARDTLHNFESGEDRIDLRSIDPNAASTGDQAFLWGGRTATEYGVWFFQSGADVVVRADTDGNRATWELTILITGQSNLEAGDFLR
jgi:Ca2+-binding RTX toxin-like protein